MRVMILKRMVEPMSIKLVSRIFLVVVVESLQTLAFLHYKGPSAFSA